jgi:glycosyltransferase involved in cell wall biosynthesis
LYNECAFTIFPSLYEGLGLPILESYIYQKACLTSNSSSMNELVIAPELKFDPGHPTDIANKIIGLFNDNEIKQQAIIDGQKILKQFSTESKKIS